MRVALANWETAGIARNPRVLVTQGWMLKQVALPCQRSPASALAHASNTDSVVAAVPVSLPESLPRKRGFPHSYEAPNSLFRLRDPIPDWKRVGHDGRKKRPCRSNA